MGFDQITPRGNTPRCLPFLVGGRRAVCLAKETRVIARTGALAVAWFEGLSSMLDSSVTWAPRAVSPLPRGRAKNCCLPSEGVAGDGRAYEKRRACERVSEGLSSMLQSSATRTLRAVSPSSLANEELCCPPVEGDAALV